MNMSSKDKEKYFWWKKDKNYYSDHRLKALEKERNGYAFSILLEKLKCESTPHLGTLKYSENRAFSLPELAAVVDMPVKLVQAGLDALQQKELIKMEDDRTIHILEFSNCIGSETYQTKRKNEVKNTKNCGKDEVNFTLESRYQSKDIRDKSIDNIFIISSSVLDRFISLGVSNEELDKYKNIISKAIQVTNVDVDDEIIEKIICELWTNQSIKNPERYVIKWLKNLKEQGVRQ